MMNVDGSDINICGLAMGDFWCRLICEEAFVAENFRRYYSGFLVNDGNPDLTLELKVEYHRLGEYETPNSLLVTKQVDGDRFSFADGLLTGHLNVADRYCSIIVKEALLGGHNIRIFEQFLYQVYYTLRYRRPSPPTSFLIHASGVSREGAGFVFTGRSGSGKSTIASLSSQETVLNDEIVIVKKTDDRFWVQSTLFNGGFEDKVNATVPLRSVFLLAHARENYLKPISKTDFVKRFVREVIVPQPLLSLDSKSAFSEVLGFCLQLVEEIPVYELGFRPDRSFWQTIKEEGLF
jgi:hypothetical protein